MSDEIVAQAVGSLIALSGVFLGLCYSQRNFIKNLQNERQKAKEQREFETKRAAYMEGAESIAHFVQYFASIPDMKVEDMQGINPTLAKFAGAVQKVHLLADFTTIKKLTDMHMVAITSINKSMLLKMPAMMIDTDISTNNSSIYFWREENRKLENEILALISSDPDSAYINDVRQRIISNSEHIIGAHERNAPLHGKKLDALNECRRSIYTGLLVINEAATEVMIAMRDELGFGIDAGRYAQLMAEFNAGAKTAIEAMITKVNEAVSGAMADPV
jgi:hypothetical protein